MVQFGNVPDIVAVKNKLDELQNHGLVRQWVLPYERLLTRLDAAIFFLSAHEDTDMDMEQIWSEFRRDPRFSVQPNSKRTLSDLDWQIQFNACTES